MHKILYMKILWRPLDTCICSSLAFLGERDVVSSTLLHIRSFFICKETIILLPDKGALDDLSVDVVLLLFERYA